MGNNYNSIANVYDFLSSVVFQKSIINAQTFLLYHTPAQSKVLIVGGGTGWVLEVLSKIHETGIEITYVEKSEKMIKLSKRKGIKHNKIQFINSGIEEFSTEKKFDVILTAFFFDNFLPAKIETVFSRLHKLLKPGGLWLYADFVNHKVNSKWWQKVLLKTMYLFFKITCNIETQQLIDMSPYFSLHYNKIAENYFYSNFIRAAVYKKRKNNYCLSKAMSGD